ncbi:hypothetical protein MN116_003881 [Schistosoma mekongi]|uniref:Protein HGH1 homolog n=1 Tax=Schistosoma mekongi TaxID=38744 RepID=A0AAE1ZFA3_SCHME|nr:hypothetical protein MN116_003881 [Schistosoma mekongi]
MTQACLLSALLKVTASRVDIEDEFLEYYLKQLTKIIISYDSTKAPSEEFILSIKCLINICSATRGTCLLRTLLSADKKLEDFTRILSVLALDSSGIRADFASLIIDLIANITRDPVWLDHFGQYFDSKRITEILNSDSSVHLFLPIVLNLSRLTSVRHSLCSSELLRKLIGLFIELTSVPSKILIAGIIKNCSFEDELHCKLIGNSAVLLDAFLISLCGPEDCIDNENRSVLPRSVQAVTGNSQFPRLFSIELYLTICQTFLQFCSTSYGRTFLRSNGVYFILRELHKYLSKVGQQTCSETEGIVSNKELLFCVEQVVDQLICEEGERDEHCTRSSLRNITVDTETEEKLEKVKKDYLECK